MSELIYLLEQLLQLSLRDHSIPMDHQVVLACRSYVRV